MTLVLWKLTIFSQKNFFKKSGKNSNLTFAGKVD